MEDNQKEIKDQEKTENKEVPVAEEGQSISDKVDKSVVDQLKEIGYSQNVAEKACFLNQNNLNASIDWIYSHQNDPDFEEELKIVGEIKEYSFNQNEHYEQRRSSSESKRAPETRQRDF